MSALVRRLHTCARSRRSANTQSSPKTTRISFRRAGGDTRGVALLHVVCADYDRVLGVSHLQAIGGRRRLAIALSEIGESGRAAAEYARLIQLQETCPAYTAKAKLQTREAHAICTGKAGDTNAAAQLLERVVEDAIRVLEADDPEVLFFRASLADWTYESGNLSESMAQRRQLAADTTRLLGPDDVETLRTLHNLAADISEAGDKAEAISILERVIARRSQVLGEDNPATISSWAHLALNLSLLGENRRAAELYEQLVDWQTRTLGRDHPETVRFRRLLAECMGKLGHARAATRLYREIADLEIGTLGHRDPVTLNDRLALAHYTMSADEHSQAADQLADLIEDISWVYGPDDRKTLGTRVNHAICIGNTGDTLKAGRLLWVIWQDYVRIFGDSDQDAANAHTKYIYWSQRNPFYPT